MRAAPRVPATPASGGRFPASGHERAEAGVRALLELVGENPDREGLRDTPARVARAWLEMTAGMREDPAEVLATTFTEQCDELVIVRDVEFVSLCEHHALPFIGTA